MKNKGFTLLLAVMAISIILVIGIGVFNIILKEMEFSNLGRETLKAFYAAESGIECVKYWDLQGGGISTTSPYSITCNGQTTTITDTDGGAWWVGSFQFNLNNGSCVKVYVDKTNYKKGEPSYTLVKAHGYNIGCDDTSSRKVEWGRAACLRVNGYGGSCTGI